MDCCFCGRSCRRRVSGCRWWRIGRSWSCCLPHRLIILAKVGICRCSLSFPSVFDCSATIARCLPGLLPACCSLPSSIFRNLSWRMVFGCFPMGVMLWSLNDNVGCRYCLRSWRDCCVRPRWLWAVVVRWCYFPPSSLSCCTRICCSLPWKIVLFVFDGTWCDLYRVGFWFCWWLCGGRWLSAWLYDLIPVLIFLILASLALICLFITDRCVFCIIATFSSKGDELQLVFMVEMWALILLHCHRGGVSIL